MEIRYPSSLSATANCAWSWYPWKRRGGRVESRIRIAPKDVYTLARRPVFVPLDRDPVGCILGAQSEPLREMSWTKPAKTNKADPRESEASNQLRAERGRQLPGKYVGIDPIVQQNAAIDHSPDFR